MLCSSVLKCSFRILIQQNEEMVQFQPVAALESLFSKTLGIRTLNSSWTCRRKSWVLPVIWMVSFICLIILMQSGLEVKQNFLKHIADNLYISFSAYLFISFILIPFPSHVSFFSHTMTMTLEWSGRSSKRKVNYLVARSDDVYFSPENIQDDKHTHPRYDFSVYWFVHSCVLKIQQSGWS